MLHRIFSVTVLLGSLLVFVASSALAQYKLTNLDSNQAGKAFRPPDPLLVNAWGLARAATSPWWVADNMSGWSTLYNGAGIKQGLNVLIPAAPGGSVGSPTGIVFNGSPDFMVQGWNAFFLFDTLDGTISAWVPQVDFTHALLVVDNSKSGAVYTALAITSHPSGNILFAADTANNRVDMFDGTFKHVGSFTDSTVPAGFTVFGIRDLNGLVYVSFANAAGGPGGFIDIFSEKGDFLKRLTQNGLLNQPWGFAAAPSGFGPLSNTLLISNNTNSGTINAYNAITGAFVGTLKDTTGTAIKINQLWAIDFGGGTPANGARNELFFTAGPNNNFSGLFGSIVFAK
jgi:uncharacterized protein (TIGR03118 family)